MLFFEELGFTRLFLFVNCDFILFIESNMKIFYDENIPYAQEFFNGFGELTAFAGRELTAEQVQDADVLLVRSITQVNASLLHLNEKIQFVGTATIGFDHIDKSYLKNRNVYFTNAPGCNAVSVAEYVLSSLMVLDQRNCLDLANIKVGIVGAGNTGTRLTEKLDALNIEYVLCDPLLEQFGDPRNFSTLTDVLSCDVISLHVPLTKEGLHPTYHLLNHEVLSKLSTQQTLINACRGEVVDNQALLQLKKQRIGPQLVLDVWENEPNILTELIPFTEIASSHIAGYSLEGKARGTEMLYQALCNLNNIEYDKQLSQFLPVATFSTTDVPNVKEIYQDAINLVFQVYDVRRDDKIFREQLSDHSFDWLRKNYPTRRELSAMSLNRVEHINKEQLSATRQIKELGFNIK